MREEFWSHVAEFPSHHRDLPPNAEAEFVESLQIGASIPLFFTLEPQYLISISSKGDHIYWGHFSFF